MTVDPHSTDSSDSVLTVSADTSSMPPGPRRIPTSMPAEQMYYWSYAWQRDEGATLAEIEGGEYFQFDSDDPTDAARWLLEPGEDDE